jgi:ACS family glucarate transporter-like MFS transporter
VRWNVLGLMFAASFVGYLLRSNLSVVAERMMADLHLSQLQFGVVLAAFAWSYALFQVPGGLWGDRIGARKAMAITAAAWGSITLLLGLIPATGVVSSGVVIAALVLLRGLMGAAQAPLYPITGGSMIFRWFPLSGWAFPNGLSSAGLTLGAAAAGPVMVWLAVNYGWRQSFLYTAPLAFLLAAAWWWYVRDTPAQHAQVRQDELALIDVGRATSTATAVAPRPWREVLANRQVLLLTASYFCSNYVFYFFFNWLYVYLVESRGFKELEGGYYAAAPWITGAVFALAGGVVCDALTRRIGIRRSCRGSAMAGLLFSGLFLVAAATATDPRITVLCLCLCMGCQQFTEAPFWAATISVAGRDAGSACGVLNTGGNVVGGVGALLVPITVKALGWPVALATGTAFAIIGASLWLWIKADATIGDVAQTTG